MLRLKVGLYLMSCFVSILAVGGCNGEDKQIARTPLPPEYIDCVVLEGTEGRPVLQELYQIPWEVLAATAQEGGWTVQETMTIARTEFEKYVTDRNSDDKEVAEYIFRLEDRVFHCASDDQWLREREKKLDQEGH